VQDHGSAVRASSDTEDDISSSGDEGDYESPEDDYDQPEDEGGAVFRFNFLFDNSVSRLGFEVAWQRRGEDDMEPSVGNVQNGGEAARRGIEAGDEIIMCNDTTTEGKVRSELIPLLKQRPLLLKVNRRLILTDPRASCVTVLTNIEIADDLGLKLLQAGEFPGLAAVRPGSAAEAAGLLAGDVIISIGAQRLEKLAMPEVKAALQKRPLSLTLWRFPLGAARWPQGFERWDSQGFGRTIVDLQTQ
jgi:C-terminal processing protease CtpA/Prc